MLRRPDWPRWTWRSDWPRARAPGWLARETQSILRVTMKNSILKALSKREKFELVFFSNWLKFRSFIVCGSQIFFLKKNSARGRVWPDTT